MNDEHNLNEEYTPEVPEITPEAPEQPVQLAIIGSIPVIFRVYIAVCLAQMSISTTP